MPVWDLPEGDEMDTHPGVRSLTRTRYKATAYLGMYVRPHKIVFRKGKPARGASGPQIQDDTFSSITPIYMGSRIEVLTYDAT